MSLVNWRKNNELFPALSSMVENFFRDDYSFPQNMMAKNYLPSVNVKTEESSYELEVAAPGLKKEDFKVEIDKGVLTISSEKESKKEDTKDNYTRKEFSYASFSRSFWLPENITEEDIKAEYTDGVLHISIPRIETEEVKNRKTVEIR